MSGSRAKQTRKEQLQALQAELLRRKHQIEVLGDALNSARLGEWSAKRGLASYMQEHGLGHRINSTVLAEINAGPPQPPVETAL